MALFSLPLLIKDKKDLGSGEVAYSPKRGGEKKKGRE
jgi:hypothetical protein